MMHKNDLAFIIRKPENRMKVGPIRYFYIIEGKTALVAQDAEKVRRVPSRKFSVRHSM